MNLPKIPFLFSSKKDSKPETDENFIAVDINQEKISLGIFNNSENSANLVKSAVEPRSADLFTVVGNVFSQVTQDKDLPSRFIIGITDPRTETMTTIAKLNRENMNEEMSGEDIEKVLTQVGEGYDAKGKQLFFSSVTSAVLDGVRIGNPIGARGTVLELGCFNAYLEKEKLDLYEKLAQEMKLSLEKIVPTEYCVVRAFLDSGTKDGILMRVLKDNTILSFVEESNIVGVRQFALGDSDISAWIEGLKVALHEFDDHPRWPTLISFYDTESFGEIQKPIKGVLSDEFDQLKEIRFENLNTRLNLEEGLATLLTLSKEGEQL